MPISARLAWITWAADRRSVLLRMSSVQLKPSGWPASASSARASSRFGAGSFRSLLAMADQARRDDPVRAVGDAEIGRLQHRVDVDRALHRLAHLGVVERRCVDVHAEPDIGERRLADQPRAGRRARLVGRQRADADRGVVELARLEGDLGRLLVLDREDLDLREAARLAVPVRVAHQRQALLGLPARRSCRGRRSPAARS